MSVQQMYPVQGTNKFETTSFPISKSFRISVTGNTAAATSPLVVFPKGSTIIGFRGRVTTALTSTGSATLQLGFSGTRMITLAMAKTTVDAEGDIVGVSVTAGSQKGGPLTLLADDTFDIITGTAKWTLGKIDVDVFYYPPHNAVLGTNYRQYLAT